MGKQSERDYGRRARIGMITPQANPTVEPEMSVLLPAGVSMLTTRCTSQGEPRQRFLNYFRQLDQTLASFDTLPLDAVGFACTASSYLLDEGEEAAATKSLEAKFGYPLITASSAIDLALQFLQAERIALACPYPSWLLEDAQAYWRKQGYLIIDSISVQPEMGDTRAIYDVSGKEAGALMSRHYETVNEPFDAIVITGTGMPALRAICDLQEETGVPVFNSNLALAWACLRASCTEPGDRSPTPGFPLLGGWREHLSLL